MQIGIRLHDTAELPLEERLDEVNKQGFSCVHLALSKVIEGYSMEPEALTPGFAMYLKRLFHDKRQDIAVLGCYLNLADPNEKQLKETVEIYKAHIRFAALLGCGVVGTETGAPNEAYVYEPACHSEEALSLFIQNFRPVVEYAEKMGVIIAIEPVWKHIVWNPERARKALDTISSPNLQIILDPVNLLDISNYERQAEVYKEAIALLGKDVAVMHLKDFAVKDGAIVPAEIGTGEMEYGEIMKFIKEKKPYIHATLEETVPENAVRSREFIKKLWEEA